MKQAVVTDFRLVLNSIKDYGIFMLDSNGYIQSWNEGAQRINGYSENEIIGKHFSIFYTNEDLEDGKPARELRIAIATGKYEEEGWRVKKDGSTFWANIIITPVYDEEHVLLGFSKVTRDLSERKKAEEALGKSNSDLRHKTDELSNANKQLELANKHLEEFASVVSHDLKEPLRKITTFAGMVLTKEKTTMSESSMVLMNKISDAANRMNVMIEDILALSMLSHKQEKQLVSLEAIVQEVLVILEQTIKDKQAIVTTDGLPMAAVVPAQFTQLFQNLISNSLKFLQDGVPPEINISHRFLTETQTLEIQVKDNGIGFEEDASDAIFGLFTRLHGRSKYEGTGLGLGICRKVVENHNGTILAKSTPGAGATFIITLPATT